MLWFELGFVANGWLIFSRRANVYLMSSVVMPSFVSGKSQCGKIGARPVLPITLACADGEDLNFGALGQ